MTAVNLPPTTHRHRQKFGCFGLRLLGLVCLFLISGCDTPVQPLVQNGATMGTYYRISTRPNECQVDQSAIDIRLQELNAHLSTYDPNSSLSQLNQAAANVPHTLAKDLAVVIDTAHAVWQSTDGAFDVTIGPLVNLWGFGPDDPSGANAGALEPSESAQLAAAQRVGMQHLDLAISQQDGHLTKLREDVYIDLSALAKGYAVDEVAGLLADLNCKNFMVDIGGEIYVAGNNPADANWRLGIEIPAAEQLGQIHTIISVTNTGVATSGDYRNFRQFEGRRVDHILDPRTGKPSDSLVVSATVVHESVMIADAYATAIMTLGEEAAMQVAQDQALPVFLLIAQPDTGVQTAPHETQSLKEGTQAQGTQAEGTQGEGTQGEGTQGEGTQAEGAQPTRPQLESRASAWRIRYNEAMTDYLVQQPIREGSDGS